MKLEYKVPVVTAGAALPPPSAAPRLGVPRGASHLPAALTPTVGLGLGSGSRLPVSLGLSTREPETQKPATP